MTTRMSNNDRDRLKGLEMEVENLKKEDESLRKDFEKAIEILEKHLDETKKIVTILDNQSKSAKIIFVFLTLLGGFFTWVLDLGSKISAVFKS